MKLHDTLERFYKSILRSAMLDVHSDGSVISPGLNKVITVSNGNGIYLPYKELLDNPTGKTFFHLLNEHFDIPETEVYKIFKHHLVEAINLKLMAVMQVILEIGSLKEKQDLIKSGDLLRLMKGVGETTSNQYEVLEDLFIKAGETNGVGRFIDFFQKKNGKLEDISYGAICKTNFVFYKDICIALDEQSGSYRLYGISVRKKDLITFKKIFETLFEGINTPNTYADGSNNKTFGYLNSLLNTTYIIMQILNNAFTLIGQDINISDDEGEKSLLFDLEWSTMLSEVYENLKAISDIPKQIDMKAEAKVKKQGIGKLSSQEGRLTEAPTAQIPTFSIPALPPIQTPTIEQIDVTTTETPSVEALLNNPYGVMNPMAGMAMNPMAMAMTQQQQFQQQLQQQQKAQQEAYVQKIQVQQVQQQAQQLLQQTLQANPALAMQVRMNPQAGQQMLTEAMETIAKQNNIVLPKPDPYGALMNATAQAQAMGVNPMAGMGMGMNPLAMNPLMQQQMQMQMQQQQGNNMGGITTRFF